MRLVWTIVLIIICDPASAQNQNQDVLDTLINPYYYCVGRATGRQSDRYANPEQAVEKAFLACQTEELAIRSYGENGGLSDREINSIIVLQRSRLKKSLVEGLERMKPK